MEDGKVEEIPQTIKDNLFSGFLDTNIILSISIGIFAILIFFIYRKYVTKKNVFLILGECNSGKTYLYSKIVFNKNIPTHSSIEENVYSFSPKADLIDIPGHPSTRVSIIQKYLKSPNVCRIIYLVINPTTFDENIADIVNQFKEIIQLLKDNYQRKYIIKFLINNRSNEKFEINSENFHAKIQNEIELESMNEGDRLQQSNVSSGEIRSILERKVEYLLFDREIVQNDIELFK
ncbi:hypothetical protein SNEBB_002732 [Seison nebaliae]|nr:hypothetical protein SNEBB_002732 [Seison nebaliae]